MTTTNDTTAAAEEAVKALRINANDLRLDPKGFEAAVLLIADRLAAAIEKRGR
jgi:hypothetical protein